jgi:very-short-patch-repair endonuclease
MEKFKARAQAPRASQTNAGAKLWQALRNRRLARWTIESSLQFE